MCNSKINFNLSEDELSLLKKDFKIIVVVGPSGSGKTTLINEFFNVKSKIVSFTTRNPRPGEIDGRDYYFVTEGEIEKYKKDNDLLEYVKYNNNSYGYSKEEIFLKLKNKNIVACAATIEGFNHLKSIFKDHLFAIYLDVDKNIVKRHLLSRNDSKDNIKNRIMMFEEESKNKKLFEQRNDSLIVKVGDDFLENVDNFEKSIVKIKNLK